MILVTVGGQLPFDRLVRTVDEWALENGRRDLYAQIGRGRYEPQAFSWSRFLDPLEFRRRAAEATCLVAHAGMGSIITALELCKPIVILPRRASMLEHRNDHQLASARRFRGRTGVDVAMDEAELRRALDGIDRKTSSRRPEGPGDTADAPNELIDALQRFVSPPNDLRG